MKDLETLRNKINVIDRQMAELFESRMEIASGIADYKKKNGLPVLDEERERRVLENNSAYIVNNSIRPFYHEFMHDIMDISKKYQSALLKGIKVAYCGIEGAFANIAAKRIFPDAELVSFRSFSDAYRSVEQGTCNLAVLPIENSSAGEVAQVSELMFAGNLYINGIYTLKVSQNLLALPGSSIEDIKTVISHQQALEQCSDYIKARGFEMVQCENTAVAARRVASQKDISRAAIASLETADLYGLEVLERDINTKAQNYTRFAVFSSVRDVVHADNSSNDIIMMFVVKNESGALLKAIEVIAKYGYNMKVLRSRPMADLAWQYYFYVEAEGGTSDEEFGRMSAELKEQCEVLKVLGTCSQVEV